ncbi:PTS sugar transporter subunit IIABC [Corynebacterium sp. HMSC22B11]|nr:PTS sugar transporter subunit IIABC [Corynebacterium sp. HMSC22B11]
MVRFLLPQDRAWLSWGSMTDGHDFEDLGGAGDVGAAGFGAADVDAVAADRGEALKAERTPVGAPLAGTTAPLSAVPHPVFASGSAGAGVAVIPDPDKEIVEVQSPVAGTIVRMQPHMFVVELEDESARVLVQMGIDTDQLNGQGFATRWVEGSTVQAGAPVVTYAPKEVGRLGYDPIVLVLALSHGSGEIEFPVALSGPCAAQDELFRV